MIILKNFHMDWPEIVDAIPYSIVIFDSDFILIFVTIFLSKTSKTIQKQISMLK